MEHEQAEAFQQLFDRRFAEILRYVYRYVESMETAKDLANDAFLRIWQRRDKVDLAGPSARSYLYSVARHKALDYLRHQQIERRWQGESAAVEEAQADPEQEFTTRETLAAIQRAVDSLPPRQREVLVLRWQRQASYDEIAQALGISSKTVAVHVSRALQHLREMLAEVR